MLKGFKDFLLRGNVVDLAVAVVIGAAFTAVVTSFTNAFLQPLIRLFSGGGEFAGTIQVNGVEFDWASFVNSAITFFITAAVVYFLVVWPMKWLQERRRKGEEDGPADPTDIELLAEIRDLLREQAARVDRIEALGGVQAPTAQLPPQRPDGYQPYPDTPYQETVRHHVPQGPGPAVDGHPAPRRRRHADPRR